MTRTRPATPLGAAAAFLLLAIPAVLAGCTTPTDSGVTACTSTVPPAGLIESGPTPPPDGKYNYSGDHPHVDFKVFLGDQAPFDFAQQRYMVTVTKDRSIHLEGSDIYPSHEWGDVIHLHDTNVTLVYFFNTLGWKSSEGSQGQGGFILTDGGRYHGEYADCRIRVFVEGAGGEWKERPEGLLYVLHHKDRVLVTYGAESDEALEFQKAAVTQKSRDSKI